MPPAGTALGGRGGGGGAVGGLLSWGQQATQHARLAHGLEKATLMLHLKFLGLRLELLLELLRRRVHCALHRAPLLHPCARLRLRHRLGHRRAHLARRKVRADAAPVELDATSECSGPLIGLGLGGRGRVESQSPHAVSSAAGAVALA